MASSLQSHALAAQENAQSGVPLQGVLPPLKPHQMSRGNKKT
jgi:hypothetical protein